MTDVRQSPMWGEYLKSLGWLSVRTQSDINIEIRKLPFGSFIKIQKPNPFTIEDLKEIERICFEHKAMFIKIEPYLGQDVSILLDNDYDYSVIPMTPTSTFYIHLDKSEQELWDNVSHSGKYSINRSKREGDTVEIYKNPSVEKLEEFFTILKLTGKVQKFYVPPFKQIQNQAMAFGDCGYLVIAYTESGEPSGAKWFLSYKNSVLYISGGTAKLGRSNKAGYQLLWESILYFKSLGLETLDLEGKDDSRFPNFTKRWGGFSHFKEKFGGEVVTFPFPMVKYISPVMKFMNKHYGFQV